MVKSTGRRKYYVKEEFTSYARLKKTNLVVVL